MYLCGLVAEEQDGNGKSDGITRSLSSSPTEGTSYSLRTCFKCREMGKKEIFSGSFQELEEILARGPNLVISYAQLLFIFAQELKEKPSLLIFLYLTKEIV